MDNLIDLGLPARLSADDAAMLARLNATMGEAGRLETIRRAYLAVAREAELSGAISHERIGEIFNETLAAVAGDLAPATVTDEIEIEAIPKGLVTFAKLFRRRNTAGREWFTGRLGHATLVILPNQHPKPTVPDLNVFIAMGPSQRRFYDRQQHETTAGEPAEE